MSGPGLLIAFGAALIMLGVAAVLLPHGWWPGRLPGDLTLRFGGGKIYVPLASCALLSAILTLVLMLLRR